MVRQRGVSRSSGAWAWVRQVRGGGRWGGGGGRDVRDLPEQLVPHGVHAEELRGGGWVREGEGEGVRGRGAALCHERGPTQLRTGWSSG